MSEPREPANDFCDHEGAQDPQTSRDRAIQHTLDEHFSKVAHEDAMDAFTYATLGIRPGQIQSGKSLNLSQRFESIMNDPMRRRAVIRDINTSVSENSLLNFRPEPTPPIIFYDEATILPEGAIDILYHGRSRRPPARRIFRGHTEGPPEVFFIVDTIDYQRSWNGV